MEMNNSIGPSGKLLCLKCTKIFDVEHTGQHKIQIWLLVQSGSSSPIIKDLYAVAILPTHNMRI